MYLLINIRKFDISPKNFIGFGDGDIGLLSVINRSYNVYHDILLTSYCFGDLLLIDDTLKSEADVEQILGWPNLTLVPRMRKSDKVSLKLASGREIAPQLCS